MRRTRTTSAIWSPASRRLARDIAARLRRSVRLALASVHSLAAEGGTHCLVGEPKKCNGASFVYDYKEKRCRPIRDAGLVNVSEACFPDEVA